MLVLHAPSNFNPTNWLISEKFDGVRSVWNPSACVFYSKAAKLINIAMWVCDAMPLCWLDGEVWFGQQMQKDVFKILHSTADKINWDDLKYVVFDSPKREEDYSDRYPWFLFAYLR
jgi:DNA ligase 1